MLCAKRQVKFNLSAHLRHTVVHDFGNPYANGPPVVSSLAVGVRLLQAHLLDLQLERVHLQLNLCVARVSGLLHKKSTPHGLNLYLGCLAPRERLFALGDFFLGREQLRLFGAHLRLEVCNLGLSYLQEGLLKIVQILGLDALVVAKLRNLVSLASALPVVVSQLGLHAIDLASRVTQYTRHRSHALRGLLLAEGLLFFLPLLVQLVLHLGLVGVELKEELLLQFFELRFKRDLVAGNLFIHVTQLVVVGSLEFTLNQVPLLRLVFFNLLALLTNFCAAVPLGAVFVLPEPVINFNFCI